MGDALFVVAGGFFAILGLACALNIAGAADRVAQYNASQSGTPGRQWEAAHRPERIYPESHAGMRLFGVAAMVAGLTCVWAGLSW